MYLTERLFPGQAGSTLLMLALAASLLSAVFYFLSSGKENRLNRQWNQSGRIAFAISFLSLMGVAASLYYMIFNHYYEYQYVWKYSSNDLSVGYLISCFWAGQEGSFIIWALLQGIIGLVLLRTAGEHEGRVMTVFALTQFFLLSMIWGVEFFGVRIGNSPFLLLKDVTANQGLEFFKDPGYVGMLRDGNGLNPLLENIWMIIHPPVLFLGYAATLVPFCFAVSSLWKRDFRSWLRPVLPWILFAVISLGTGIMLGGAWAYVDLTFGGFWAWDPVENASLVPWMFLLAALHALLIAKNRNHGYGLALLLTLLSFVLVVYASFLTRSGLLGDTSAHSFADDGLAAQMLVFMIAALVVPIFLLIKNQKKLPRKPQDDSSSREFWMFIGTVVLFLSAFQIIATTSLPVLNRIIGTSFAPPIDRNAFYNNWQLPFAVVIALLAGFSLLIHYGKNEMKKQGRMWLILISGSIILTTAIAFGRDLFSLSLLFLVFSAVFAMLTSAWYLVKRSSGFRNTGAAISHLGLGIFLAGIVFAFGQSSVISRNNSGFFAGQGQMSAENQILKRDDLQQMGNYYVVYAGMKQEGKRLVYQLDFLKKGPDDLLYLDFSMFPQVVLNSRMGNVYTPAVMNFFRKDLFIHITWADVFSGFPTSDYTLIDRYEVEQGDSVRLPGYYLRLDTLLIDYAGSDTGFASLRIDAPVTAFSGNGIMMQDTISYSVENSLVDRRDALNSVSKHKYVFASVGEKPKTIVIEVYEPRLDYIVVKAREFPYIWVVWAGSLVMLAGLLLAMAKRIKRKPAVPEA